MKPLGNAPPSSLGAALFKDDGMFRPGQEWALEVTDEARKPIYFIEIAAWQAE
jgi:hypothetical protein